MGASDGRRGYACRLERETHQRVHTSRHRRRTDSGTFPPQISPESIKEPHESYPYNLKIAEALYKSTYLESWGSGAKRIMDACREQGVEEPTWRWDGGFVAVTFKRPKHAPGWEPVAIYRGTSWEPVGN